MNCKNCQTSLIDQSDYCNVCGAKVIRNRLTIKALFSHISEEFFTYDNKLLQTFIDLFKTPENVIGNYIDGTRKKYVNIISYFALAITAAGLQIIFLNKFFPELVDFSAITVEGQEEAANQNYAFVQEYQSIILMFYVPIYALMSKIVFFNIKKYNYTEHLVIFMYIIAQMSVLGAIVVVFGAFLGITLGTISLIFMPVQLLYSAYCLKRLYNLSLKGIILRTLFFILVLGVMFVIFSILYLIIIYFTGDLQNMIEAQRAAEEASGS